jgi:hypothetical protein
MLGKSYLEDSAFLFAVSVYLYRSNFLIIGEHSLNFSFFSKPRNH